MTPTIAQNEASARALQCDSGNAIKLASGMIVFWCCGACSRCTQQRISGFITLTTDGNTRPASSEEQTAANFAFNDDNW